MASFTASEPDGTHGCPHCGAHYKVTLEKIPKREEDKETCQCCSKEMARWNMAAYPDFELIGGCPGDENVRFL